MHTLILVVIAICSTLFISASSLADMPLPASKEEIAFRIALSKVEDIYVFEKHNDLYESTGNKQRSIDYLSNSQKYAIYFDEDHKEIGKKLEHVFKELSPQKKYNIHHGRAPHDQYNETTALLTYRYNFLPTNINDEDYGLGMIEFRLEFGANPILKKNDYQVNMLPELFIIKTSPNHGEENSQGSYSAAIERSLNNIKDFFLYQSARINSYKGN